MSTSLSARSDVDTLGSSAGGRMLDDDSELTSSSSKSNGEIRCLDLSNIVTTLREQISHIVNGSQVLGCVVQSLRLLRRNLQNIRSFCNVDHIMMRQKYVWKEIWELVGISWVRYLGQEAFHDFCIERQGSVHQLHLRYRDDIIMLPDLIQFKIFIWG